MDDIYPTEFEVVLGTLTILLREEKDVETKIIFNSEDIKKRVQKEVIPRSETDISDCTQTDISQVEGEDTTKEFEDQDCSENTTIPEDTFADMEDKPSEPTPLTKKLFKQIALVTHPDKVKDEKHNKLFLLSRTAQDKNDILTLLFILSKCTSKIILIHSEILEVKVILDQRKNSVVKKKETVTYKWNTYTEEVKQILIKKITPSS